MDLEQRIAAALTNETITSDALADLFAETRDALAVATQAVEDERRRALDVTQSRDPTAALAALQAAELSRDRLQAALPRLQARYHAARTTEQVAAWAPTYEAAAAEQAALAEELAALYQPFIVRFTDLMSRIEQHRATANAVNAAKPSVCHGDGRRLDDQIGVHIRRDLKLPAWDPKAGLAWPPYRPIDPAMVTPIVPGDWRLTTARWHEAQRERAEAVREQAKHAQQQHDDSAREQHHGPRWWEGELSGPERAL